MPESRNDSFQRALDEALRRDLTLQDLTINDNWPGPVGGPRVRANFELGPALGSGGEARFGLALEWTDEPAHRLGRHAPAFAEQAAGNPADMRAEIAAELGLPGPLTRDQLGLRWRNFVWRNHPDRQPAHARARANARVAIANSLYDRARRELAKPR
jgi:hypothetical protein